MRRVVAVENNLRMVVSLPPLMPYLTYLRM